MHPSTCSLLLLLLGYAVALEDYEKVCVDTDKVMDEAAKASGCGWIKEEENVDYEELKTPILECYNKYYKISLSNGEIEIDGMLKSLEATAKEGKKEALQGAVKDCNPDDDESLSGDKLKQFTECYFPKLAVICAE